MAISIDWITKIITVPKADMTLIQTIPAEIRELNVNTFRIALKDIEDNAEGMTFLDTHSHNTEVTLGGIVYARVFAIINGYSVEFEDDQYTVNCVGANHNLADVKVANQVSLIVNNAAGLISNAAIEFSSFENAVTIDANNITGKALPGTTFPAGTRQQPCINTADAALIASVRGLSSINVIGNLTLTTGDHFQRFEFNGESPLKSILTIEPDAKVLNCEFYDCNVTGVLDGNSQIERSVITGLEFVDGYIYRCAIGPATIQLGLATIANIFSCYSTVPGISSPTIDMNGTGIIALRDYTGGMLLKNYNGNSSHSIDLNSGQLKLDTATITSGTFIVRGTGKLIDELGNRIFTGIWNGGVTVINQTTDATSSLVEELHRIQGLDRTNPMVITPTQRTAGDIDLELTGDGETITTVTRQP